MASASFWNRRSSSASARTAGLDHLQRDGAVEADLAGLVDDAHAAAAELLADLVVAEVAHGGAADQAISRGRRGRHDRLDAGRVRSSAVASGPPAVVGRGRGRRCGPPSRPRHRAGGRARGVRQGRRPGPGSGGRTRPGRGARPARGGGGSRRESGRRSARCRRGPAGGRRGTPPPARRGRPRHRRAWSAWRRSASTAGSSSPHRASSARKSASGSRRRPFASHRSPPGSALDGSSSSPRRRSGSPCLNSLRSDPRQAESLTYR